MLNQLFLGIAPKAFKTIDIDFPIGKFFMVNPEMFISTEHKGIIAPKLNLDTHAPSSNHLNSQVKQGFCCDILDDFCLNITAPFLKEPEYRDFVVDSTIDFS